MKKLFLFLIVLLTPTICSADHWVYVRLADRVGPNAEDTVGRSKYGDIVDIRPVDEQNIPSEAEQREYLIVRVRGLDDVTIQELRSPWTEVIADTIRTKAYRKNLFDVQSAFVQNLTPGLWPNTVNYNTIRNRIRIKTDTDLAKYEAKTRLYAMYRPLKIAYYWYANRMSFAYAETISTINKTGEDYNTLTLWEDAKDGDLVAETRQETAEVYGDDGTLDDFLVIDGSTTDSTYFMKITVPSGERHTGIFNTGAKLDHSSAEDLINISDGNVVIQWLELNGNSCDNTNDYIIRNSVGPTTLENMLIQGDEGELGGILMTGVLRASNLIFYRVGAFNRSQISEDGSSGANFLYNITIYDGGRAINDASTGTGDKYTNIGCFAAQTCFLTLESGECNYCISSDGTADDFGGTGNQVDATDYANYFVSVAGLDFHVKDADSILYEAGTDLSGDADNPFSIDIDNETRAGTWDVGADEFFATASRRIIFVQ